MAGAGSADRVQHCSDCRGAHSWIRGPDCVGLSVRSLLGRCLGLNWSAGRRDALHVARTHIWPSACRASCRRPAAGQWETTTHSDSAIVWFILILSPTGDLPYFLAGLSSTRYLTIFLLSLAIRVPTTFVVTSAGAGVMLLNWWQLATALIALIVLMLHLCVTKRASSAGSTSTCSVAYRR